MSDKKNFFSDNDDLLFHFKNSLEWRPLIELTESLLGNGEKPSASIEEALEGYQMILDQVGHYAGHEIAPKAAALDENGARLENGKVVLSKEFEQIFDGLREMELYGLTIPKHLGGLNAPMALSFILTEVMARADVSVMTHFGFHGPIAMAFLLYAAKEGSLELAPGGWIAKSRFDGHIRKIAKGEAWGTMELTEPQAGSDLGALRTTGKLGEDEIWRVSGQKIFITSGHSPFHLVLAKTEEAADSKSPMPGLDALSLFFVPTCDRVKIERVEEKMGHHASPTCALVYDEAPADLIGRRGQGFELMLVMMNGARLGVGFEAIGVAQAAFEMARAYAQERWTMGRPIIEHELIADKLIQMETDIRGLRAMAFEALSSVELSHKLEMHLKYQFKGSDEQRRKEQERLDACKRRARELTPLLKMQAGEKAVEICRANMQIHGGFGYIREYGAEKLLRDALVIPVYEGTTQIQALMALKDHLQFALREPLEFVKDLGRARLNALRTRGVDKLYWECVYEQFRSMEAIVLEVIKSKMSDEWTDLKGKNPLELWKHLSSDFLRHWDARKDFAYGLLQAEKMAEILAHVAIARILRKQAKAHPERKIWAERYVKRMHARIVALGTSIRAGDKETLEWIERRRAGQA